MQASNIDTRRWFYQDTSGKQGPIDFRELHARILQGSISAETEIWKHDDPEKRSAKEIAGLPFPKEADSQAHSERQVDPPRSRRTMPRDRSHQRSILDGPPGGLYLPHLKSASFSLLLLLLLSCIACSYLAVNTAQSDFKIPIFCFAAFSGLGFITFSLIYLGRAWDMLKTVGSKKSGTHAATMMAIPLYNALAGFSLVFGWSGLWNYQIKHHPGFSTSRKVFRPVFFLFCLGLLASQSFFVYYFIIKKWRLNLDLLIDQIALTTWGATLLLGLASWAGICRTINFLAKKKS